MPPRPRMIAPVGKSGPGMSSSRRSKSSPDCRSAPGRRRSPRPGCAAVCWSPCRPRCRRRRSPAGSGTGPAGRSAPDRTRRSSAGNRPCPCRCRSAGHQRPGQGAPRCSASPPADRRPSSRSCPGRRSAPGAWRSPGPCAPTRRRWRPGHADGTCPSRRRRCVRTCAAAGHIRSRPRASRRGSGDAPASGRRARRAALAPRSRSWRNRGRSAASPPRSGRPLRGGAGWKPKLNCPAGERTLKHRPVARRASSV